MAEILTILGILLTLFIFFQQLTRSQEDKKAELQSLVDENAYLAEQMEEELRLFMENHGYTEDDVYLEQQGETMTFGDCLDACIQWRNKMQPAAEEALSQPASRMSTEVLNNLISRLRNNLLHFKAAKERLERIKEIMSENQ